MNARKRRRVLETSKSDSLPSPSNREESTERDEQEVLTNTTGESEKYGKYFTFSKDKEGENEVKFGSCKIPSCHNSKRIKMKNRNTTGLKWHLQRHHKDIHDQLFQKAKKDSCDQQKIDEMNKFAFSKKVIGNKVLYFSCFLIFLEMDQLNRYCFTPIKFLEQDNN